MLKLWNTRTQQPYANCVKMAQSWNSANVRIRFRESENYQVPPCRRAHVSCGRNGKATETEREREREREASSAGNQSPVCPRQKSFKVRFHVRYRSKDADCNYVAPFAATFYSCALYILVRVPRASNFAPATVKFNASCISAHTCTHAQPFYRSPSSLMLTKRFYRVDQSIWTTAS